MPLFNSSLITSAADDSTPADPVTRSLRFDEGNSPYFVRAASDIGTPTDAKKVTVAFWFKLGNMSGTRRGLVSSSNSPGSDYWMAELDASDRISWGINDGSASVQGHFTTNRVFRDPSAWYHVCFSVDSTAAEADRAIIYINGVRETAFDTINYWPPDWLNEFNEGTYSQSIGSWKGTSMFFDGLIADVYNIDGQQLEPSEFIESNGYGGYKPKEYTGTYGTNGWHIDMQPQHDADLLVSSIDRNDGDTLFADCAGHTLTENGDPEHSIAVGNPFTGDDKAIYFDGSSYGLETDSSTDFALDTDDCTIEFWINGEFDTTWPLPIASSDTSSGPFLYFRSDKSIYIYQGSNTLQWSSPTNTLKDNEWQHFAFCRKTISGTTYNRMWVDGKEISPVASASTTYNWSWGTSAQSIKIAAANYNYLKGYLHDVRIIKGTAAYWGSGTNGAGDITVPATKLTAVTNTKLLIQPTPSSDSSWSDIDKSGVSGRTISHSNSVAYADPTASTPYDAAAKSTAMYFAGTGDNLVVTSDSSFNEFGTGDFTIEMWVNPTDQGSGSFAQMFELYGSSSDRMYLRIERQSSQNVYKFVNAGSNDFDVESDSAPDYGNWQHLAVVRNGTSITMYVDGTAQTDSVTISSSATYNWASTNLNIGKGSVGGSSADYEGYIFDYRITKGTARYTSDFSSSLPSAPFELNPVYIGGDQSGNKNHFQPTNISSHDVMLDTPTKNYATLNPLQKAGTQGNDPSEGNLSLTGGSLPSKAFSSTISANSGKYYAEFYLESYGYPTVSVADVSMWVDGYGTGHAGRVEGNGVITYDIRSNGGSGDYYINSTSATSGVGVTAGAGDIIQVAFDADTRKVWFGRNGTWYDSGDPEDGTNHVGVVAGTDALTFILRSEVSSGSGTTVVNYGQDPTFINGINDSGFNGGTQDTSQSEFYYAPPNGYKSLNTSNLDDPTVTPSENFDITLWQGNSTNNEDITGLDFDPTDGVLTWIKNRDDSGAWNVLFDSVRGAGNQLATNETDAELASASNIGGKVSQWNDNGFRVAQGSGTTPLKSVNESSDNYVAWNWKAHQSPSSSSSGSAKQKYKFYCEDLSGDDAGWDFYGDYTDSNGNPSINMEVLENQNGTRVSLGYVYVLYNEDTGIDTNQTFTLECADIDAIEIRWHYDDSNDSTSDYTSDNTYSYTAVNTILNAQRLTVYSGAAGTTQEFQVSSADNEEPQDDGVTDSYSPPTGWADGNVIKTATASNTDSSTYASSTDLTDGFTPEPVEKYNSAAGFSIITYTGDGSSDDDTQEITHTLGAEPEFIIAKSRSSSSSNGTWSVYHKHTGLSSSYSTHKHLRLDVNSAASELYYDMLIPKSGSENTIINTNYNSMDGIYTNESGVDYVMYAFAPVEGYSKFGKYTGNGDDDGTFVYTGFRPAFVIIKSLGTQRWALIDSVRGPINPNRNTLYAEDYIAEYTGTLHDRDFLSNGFKLRNTDGIFNTNDQEYIYCAWAEQPFAAPSNAR